MKTNQKLDSVEFAVQIYPLVTMFIGPIIQKLVLEKPLVWGLRITSSSMAGRQEPNIGGSYYSTFSSV